MASIANRTQAPSRAADDRFFLIAAFIMSGIIVAGFSMNIVMGRSSFGAPPLVHAHAIVFMGWMVIYLLQTVFATVGPIALHRRLGWLATAWILAMLVLGTAVTVAMVRQGRVPFFFQPLHFLVFDPVAVLGFAGLMAAGIAQRRDTAWHRRLNFCGMALLTGPGFGRLLPIPLLVPYAYHAAFAATLILPLIGAIVDIRRSGRVHPAWWWGIGAMLATEIVIDLIAFTPIGLALYQAVTAGSPGAAIAPLAFPPSPLG